MEYIELPELCRISSSSDGKIRLPPDLNKQILIRLEVIGELLATMHPFKPEIHFTDNGYEITWHALPDGTKVHES